MGVAWAVVGALATTAERVTVWPTEAGFGAEDRVEPGREAVDHLHERGGRRREETVAAVARGDGMATNRQIRCGEGADGARVKG